MIEPQIPDCPRCKGTGVSRGKGMAPYVCTCGAGRHVGTIGGGIWMFRREPVLEIQGGSRARTE